MYNQIMQNQIQQLFGMGAADTARGDMWNQMGYQDFMANRMGYLPMLLQAMTGGGSPVNPSGGTNIGGSGGSNWMDWLSLIGNLFPGGN